MKEETIKKAIKVIETEIYKIDKVLKTKAIATDGKEDDKHITSSKFLQFVIQKARLQSYAKALADVLCGKFDEEGEIEDAVKSAKQPV